jgi:uncharacterized protein YodC (DUF2158 family)
MSLPFNLGDIVTKLHGKKPAKITYVSDYSSTGYYTCKYLHNNQSFSCYGCDLKLYEEETEMTADTKTLYSFTVDGVVAYGTHIGTNSSNQYLIEEKGTGKIHVFDKKDLEEVVPYTFSATMGGKETHYVGTPGALNKGDVLLYTGSSTPNVAVVTGVDTKNKSARSKFKGAKIVTEAI